MTRPLAIDLFTGLHGWAEGFITEGWRVRGFDLEDMSALFNHPKPNHFELVLHDVLALHGSQFADADCIVASPPCQEYSFMAMPWTRAKQIARALRGEDDFPEGYKGSRTIDELNALFNACFRLQREACEAAGRHIPLVVENVRGAQPWVGRAAWNFGSYYLWGDVPALMPIAGRAQKFNPDGTKHGQGSWFAVADSKRRGSRKNTGGSWFNIGSPGQKVTSRNPVHALTGRKHKDQDGYERDHPAAFGWKAPRTSSASAKRKHASAMIAKIPEDLSRHIARTFLPNETERRTAACC